MGADAHPEEKRKEGEAEHVALEVGSKPCSDRDVREMPERVRRMQQRDVVAPSPWRERVEGGTGGAGHVRRPQVTIPPPRLRRCEVAPAIPAASQSSSR